MHPTPPRTTSLVANPTVYLVMVSLFVPLFVTTYTFWRTVDWRCLGVSLAVSAAGGAGLRAQPVSRIALVLIAAYLACIVALIILESLSRPTTGWKPV